MLPCQSTSEGVCHVVLIQGKALTLKLQQQGCRGHAGMQVNKRRYCWSAAVQLLCCRCNHASICQSMLHRRPRDHYPGTDLQAATAAVSACATKLSGVCSSTAAGQCSHQPQQHMLSLKPARLCILGQRVCQVATYCWCVQADHGEALGAIRYQLFPVGKHITCSAASASLLVAICTAYHATDSQGAVACDYQRMYTRYIGYIGCGIFQGKFNS